MPNPNNIKTGPGWLYVAPLGSTEPVDLTTAWDGAWTQIGYTEEGHTFSSDLSVDPIEVAESLYAIRYEVTGVQLSVSFSMAEFTVANLQAALNGGTATVSGAGATQITTFEPPDIGEETRLMLGWESDDATERWIWRKCLAGGSVDFARSKKPDKALIPVEFQVEVPLDGSGNPLKPWAAILSTPA